MLKNLQAARGAACLLVVLYHVGTWEAGLWTPVHWLRPLRYFGFAGVDLFFVLSGFIITRAHISHLGVPRKLPRYLFRRAWRVYPPYVAAFAVAACVNAFISGHPLRTAEWPAWLLLSPDGGVNAVIPVAWSLTFELMFYAAFGVLFLLPRRLAWLPVAAWAVVVVAAGIAGVAAAGPWSHLALHPFVLEFLAGGVVAAVVGRGVTGRLRCVLAASVAWAIGGGMLAHSVNPDVLAGSTWPRVLAFGPAAAGVVYALAAGELHGTIATPRLLQRLGNASYSVYLGHMTFGTAVLYLSWGIGHGVVMHVVWLGIMSGAAVGGGAGMYGLVERSVVLRYWSFGKHRDSRRIAHACSGDASAMRR